MEQKVVLSKFWMDGADFDSALALCPDVLLRLDPVTIVISARTSLKIGCTLRLLSFSNQAANAGIPVVLDFEGGESGTMGYISRMGFFEHLDPRVSVLPHRPTVPRFQLYRGMNSGLVEIAVVSMEGVDKRLPGSLSDAVAGLYGRADKDEFGGAVFTALSELTQNIPLHSQSTIGGYAALQHYPKRKTVEVAVSDSGIGILNTLRPALEEMHHKYADLPDSQLLFKAISEGVSRNGESYGCGLSASARQALRYRADFEVRLPSCRVTFLAADGHYRIQAEAVGTDKVPYLGGTHICFDYRLV